MTWYQVPTGTEYQSVPHGIEVLTSTYPFREVLVGTTAAGASGTTQGAPRTFRDQSGNRLVSSTELNVYKKGALPMEEKVRHHRGRFGFWAAQVDTDGFLFCVHPRNENLFWLDVAKPKEPCGFPSEGENIAPPRGAGESLQGVWLETTWFLTRKTRP